MTDVYEIRKDIPMPAPEEKTGLCATIRRMAYGDSIVIAARQQMTVHTSAKSVGAKVKTRNNGDGTITVWRVDPAAPGSVASPTLNSRPAVIADPAIPDYSVDSPPGAWPQIVTTVANPSQGYPEGYYMQQNRYSPRVWIQGRPPETPVPDPAPAPKKTIFD